LGTADDSTIQEAFDQLCAAIGVAGAISVAATVGVGISIFDSDGVKNTKYPTTISETINIDANTSVRCRSATRYPFKIAKRIAGRCVQYSIDCNDDR
jgi:hypothetical protein